jgi:predicted DNA-binding antitoxin AbrB/MazE fold protein
MFGTLLSPPANECSARRGGVQAHWAFETICIPRDAGIHATIGIEKQATMTIPATYENGVFKPLGDVKLTEGTRVEVHVPAEDAPRRSKSVRDSPIFGMWADREDIPDGVTYVNRLREPRY